MASNALCTLCRDLNVDSLSSPGGYEHWETFEQLLDSNKTCPICKIISDALKEDANDDSEPRSLLCQLRVLGEGTYAYAGLEVTRWRRQGLVRVYTTGGK